jgi:hypothetical protein
MNRFVRVSLAAAVALAAGLAMAQGGMGPGPGASMPGGGMGPGGGPRYGAGVTPGWQLMSPEERTAHQAAMGNMKTQSECNAYVEKHHQDMVGRAKERGQTLPAQPRHDRCAGLAK